MAITIQVTQDDLLQTRFAYSPLVETTISYFILLHPEAHSLYRRWVDETLRALHGIDLPFMTDLIAAESNCHYLPDFLTPTPRHVQLNIESEIQDMLNLPDEIILASIHRLIEHAGESDIRLFFLAHTREALRCLADELRLYWQRALEPHWSRFTAILEGDVLYHARQQALDGTARMLNEIHPRLTYQDNVIQIEKPRLEELQLCGEGLQLVPSIFAGRSIHWQIVPEWHPMLIYSARGVGLWQQAAPERNPSLEIALGEGRARVLQMLATPSNTTEIARKLHITASAASQHLNRLNQAGLVEPYRNGKRVYYHLTDRGAQLLALFA